MEYNDAQRLASEISGFELNESFSSAKNDYYYECETLEEKFKFLEEYVCHADSFSTDELPIHQIKKVLEFLEADFENSSAMDHAFIELK
jgi:hypothetical protein